jgi:DNA-binding transcriptional ArsR family regulator
MAKDDVKPMLDLVLHPVRMRILTALAGSPGLTPQQIADRMADVPQATLYRHINRLVRAGALAVVAERPVRGTLEKVYALNSSTMQPVNGEAALDAFNRMSKEEHLHYFSAFTLTLLDDFARYLNQPRASTLDFAADGVGYQKNALFLNDEEMAALAAALGQALAPFFALPNAPGRRKRLFTTILMPSEDQPGSTEGRD